jgi:N6-adenosine-specific RNA methylase IME4
MSKKYSVIVCDMPWSFSDKLQMDNVKRGAVANYNTMSLKEIKELPIAELANFDGCILCLWCPSSLLKEGLEVMLTYKFEVKQTYIWVKTKNLPLDFFRNSIIKVLKQPEVVYDKFAYTRIVRSIADSVKYVGQDLHKILGFNMGRLFRQTHEICLIGTNNNKIYKKLQNRSQRSVSFAPNLGHSTKPEHLQDSLDIMFPDVEKLELFARRIRPNWTCLGNAIDGLDIREALNQLK